MEPRPGSPARPPLAALLAGGESRRFGAPKALARVGGVRVVDRVLRALRETGAEVGVVGSRPEWLAELGLPVRPDVVAGAGALGGVHAALRWAVEEGRPGALCVACDMPFLPAGLLRRLLERGAGTGADAVVPESTGRRGVEPLCAFYGAACLGVAEAMLAGGERRMTGLLERVRTVRLPLEEVREWGDPGTLF
ncbi:MAG TPA: molybdenum cofactor guanylyltransferase, partial [Longimicrobiaceae bacterium]